MTALREELAEARALVRRLKHLQNLLGELHDMHSWMKKLRGGSRKPQRRKRGACMALRWTVPSLRWRANREFELRDEVGALRAAIGPGNASGSSAV